MADATGRPVAPADNSRFERRQTTFVLCYFALYLAYLWVRPEGELLHWLSLVVLPLAGLAVAGRQASVRSLLSSVGVGSQGAGRGLGIVTVFAAGFTVLQLMNARQRAELMSILATPYGPGTVILAFFLLIGTVATTEEVFFRGILQSRVASQFRSEAAGILVATLAFIVYHIPYAYLKPSWPSVGDLSAAVQLAVANGLPTGLALGVVYSRSKRNLAAAILLHALIDLAPATRLVHAMLVAR
jgi:membrane protease YdiL (CAAX protease family)